MRADEGGMSAAERNRDHMAQVRAIHRRSAYERVTRKIDRYEQLQRAADVGLAGVSAEHCRAELSGLHELRDALWREMVEAGRLWGDRSISPIGEAGWLESCPAR